MRRLKSLRLDQPGATFAGLVIDRVYVAIHRFPVRSLYPTRPAAFSNITACMSLLDYWGPG